MTCLKDLERRFDALEATVEQQASRIEELEKQIEVEQQARQEAKARVDTLETQLDRQNALLEALQKRATTTRDMVGELQSRELEKGAHLQWDHIKPTLEDDQLDLPDDRLERISKDEGQYTRLPETDDPLDRGGSVQLAHGDLLPIQQLAQLDEDTRRTVADARPDRLAAKAWNARDDPASDLWNQGCNGVKTYLDAGELATWIRIEEGDVSREYATKLARRTIDALLDLANNRLYDELRTRRSDGLTYKERRVILPTDADIPGERTQPAAERPPTDGVVGD